MTLVEIAKDITTHLGGTYWPSNRMWTRGDGVRYKEPNKISLPYNTKMEYFWYKLQKLFPKHKTIKVSGEFGSSGFDDAITVGGVVLINRKSYITISSRSILRNTAIWSHKEA